jgi:cell division protein FtsQ
MWMLISTPTFKKAPPPKRNRPLEEVQSARKRPRSFPGIRLGGLRLGNQWLYLVGGLLLLGLLALANRYHETMALRDIEVHLAADADNAFLNLAAVKDIIGVDETRPYLGEQMSSIELEAVEDMLLANPFVKEAEVYKSYAGVMHIELGIRKPVARLVNNSGGFLYLDENGLKMPASDLHSAYVPLIRGDFEEEVMPQDSFACSTIPETLPVLRYIEASPLWNAMVSEVVISQSGEIELVPQLGNMTLEFGYPVRVAEKFGHLEDFFHQVIRQVGWDHYRHVSVKYRGQVVAK